MKNKHLKILAIGFDWRGIGKGDYRESKKKLDRDGLNTGINDFVMIYLGDRNGKESAGVQAKFIVWHIYFFTRLRIVYDLLLVIILPLVLVKEKYKPNIFYATEFPFLISQIIPAKILKSKIYFRVLNLPTELALAKGKKGKLFYLYYKIVEKITVRFVDRFIAINETTKKYLLNLGVSEKKIFFDIPNTIESDKIFVEQADKTVIRKHFNVDVDKKIIISIGSLIKEKGFVDLIETFVKLKRDDLVLIICGQGKEENNLKKLTRELGADNKIIFAGQVNRENLWHYLAGADIFMLFSKSESLGMVFWEAMYAGVPVIGAPVGGITETIGHDRERGFFWLNNSNDLNKKINFCLTESREKEALINRARDYVIEKLKIKKNINEIF